MAADRAKLCIERHWEVMVGLSTSPCATGVPQGSVLGPLLFTTYTSPVASTAASHNVRQQQYADDAQLFVSLSLPYFSSDMNKISSCLNSLYCWFSENGMALDPDKSESILFGTRQRSN